MGEMSSTLPANISYLADQANMPYGNYDAEGKRIILGTGNQGCAFPFDDNYYETQYNRNPMELNPGKNHRYCLQHSYSYGLKDITSPLEKSNIGSR